MLIRVLLLTTLIAAGCGGRGRSGDDDTAGDDDSAGEGEGEGEGDCRDGPACPDRQCCGLVCDGGRERYECLQPPDLCMPENVCGCDGVTYIECQEGCVGIAHVGECP